MHFPGGSDTRENLLPYKYTKKKPTKLRLPRRLEEGPHRWNRRNVRLVTGMMFGTIALQTLRCSVRSFYKLRCSVRLVYKKERLALYA